MIKETFKKFVEQKVAEASAQPINWEQEKKTWLARLAELHAQVTSWLTPYITNHGIQIRREIVPLVEESIGSYQAPMMTITIGNNQVKLEPIGTLLIGARGRVDMTGPKGVARLVIVPKESPGPRARAMLPGQIPSLEEAQPVSEWVWKLASPPPRITYAELTEESFLDALMGVANG